MEEDDRKGTASNIADVSLFLNRKSYSRMAKKEGQFRFQ